MLKSTKDSAVSCPDDAALVSRLSSQARSQCVTHLASCKQSTKEEGTEASSNVLPHVALLATSCMSLLLPPGWLQAVDQKKQRRRARNSLHDHGYRPPQPVATSSTARTAKPASSPKIRRCIARVTLSLHYWFAAKQPVGVVSRPRFKVIERSLLQTGDPNRVRLTVRRPSRRDRKSVV